MGRKWLRWQDWIAPLLSILAPILTVSQWSILTTSIARFWPCISSSGCSINIGGSSRDGRIKPRIGSYIPGILNSTGRREIQVAFHQYPRSWAHKFSRERNCFRNSVNHLLKDCKASIFKRLRWRSHSFNRVVVVWIKYTEIRSKCFVLRCNQRATCLSRAVKIFVDTDIIKDEWCAIKMIGTPIAILSALATSLRLYHLPNSWLIQDCNH